MSSRRYLVYAIVRAGGRQEKVAVGDLISLDRVQAKPGETVILPTVLIVDGDKVNTDAKGVTVTAEVIDHNRGPKIEILRYKNKTGYRRRQGHRSDLTDVQIISIGSEKIAAGDKATAKAKPVVAKKAAPVKAAPAAKKAAAPAAEAAPAAKKAAAPAKKAAPAKAVSSDSDAKATKAPASAAKKAAPAKKAPAAKKASTTSSSDAKAKKSPASAPKKTEK
ncbi:MAG: 50S ribosomal protein L21 [Actinobacteria bacterium]|nr:50S ribosomal protein L21 [Actinomycetota bacterium]